MRPRRGTHSIYGATTRDSTEPTARRGTDNSAMRRRGTRWVQRAAVSRPSTRTDDLFITSSGMNSSATSAGVHLTSSDGQWRTSADTPESLLTQVRMRPRLRRHHSPEGLVIAGLHIVGVGGRQAGDQVTPCYGVGLTVQRSGVPSWLRSAASRVDRAVPWFHRLAILYWGGRWCGSTAVACSHQIPTLRGISAWLGLANNGGSSATRHRVTALPTVTARSTDLRERRRNGT